MDVIPKDSWVHVCTNSQVVSILLVLLLVTPFSRHWVTHLISLRLGLSLYLLLTRYYKAHNHQSLITNHPYIIRERLYVNLTNDYIYIVLISYQFNDSKVTQLYQNFVISIIVKNLIMNCPMQNSDTLCTHISIQHFGTCKFQRERGSDFNAIVSNFNALDLQLQGSGEREDKHSKYI